MNENPARDENPATAQENAQNSPNGMNLSLHIGSSDEEVAEIEALASARTVLHWPALLRLIARMRAAEGYAWDMRADLADRDATIRGQEEYIADANKLLRQVSAVLENGYAIGFEQRYRIAEKIYQFLKPWPSIYVVPSRSSEPVKPDEK